MIFENYLVLSRFDNFYIIIYIFLYKIIPNYLYISYN